MGYVTAGLLNELVSVDFLKELVPAGLLMTRSRQVTKSKARLGTMSTWHNSYCTRSGRIFFVSYVTAGYEIESEVGHSYIDLE